MTQGLSTFRWVVLVGFGVAAIVASAAAIVISDVATVRWMIAVLGMFGLVCLSVESSQGFPVALRRGLTLASLSLIVPVVVSASPMTTLHRDVVVAAITFAIAAAIWHLAIERLRGTTT